MSAPSSGGAATALPGRERRRFPRYEIEIPVLLRKRLGDLHLVTADVSRHGAFLRTDQPAPLRQLVQLRFSLPGHGDIDAMCMVARWLRLENPRGPGMGLDFFALSKEAKISWERFVADLRARDSAVNFGFDDPSRTAATLSLSLSVPAATTATVGPDGMPDWLATNSISGDVKPRHTTMPASTASTVPALPGQALIAMGPAPASAAAAATWLPQASTSPVAPPPPPNDDDLPIARIELESSVVILRLPDRDQLRGFVANEVERGGMFLKTPLQKEVGEKIDVVIVHPESDDEFHLDGTVVRRVVAGPAEARGLGIFFRALSADGHERLLDFVESGVEVIEVGTPLSARQLELEAAVTLEPDSAEAQEALGTFLLDEEGDLGGALTALTRALILGPSQVSIHASLARAYRRIGDPSKVRAHERVAEALMMFQDRLKVRMGVGDD